MLVMDDTASYTRSVLLGHMQVARVAGSARRCLFGRADPEQSKEFLRKELDIIFAEQKKRWNFDFEREVPMDGRYQWESVGSSSPRESMTERCFVGQKRCLSDISSSEEAPVEDNSAVPKRSRQLHITDMLRISKHTSLVADVKRNRSCDESTTSVTSTTCNTSSNTSTTTTVAPSSAKSVSSA